MIDISKLTFDEKNLIPVIAQSVKSGKVLMFAFANKEALQKTQKTGFAHFYSRSTSITSLKSASFALSKIRK